MAFLLGLRFEFLLLHFLLKLQCIDRLRCLIQDLILKIMKNKTSNVVTWDNQPVGKVWLKIYVQFYFGGMALIAGLLN